MSTYNLAVNTTNWTKIVEANDTDFLVTWDVAKTVEFASTELNEEPTITGHRMTRENKVSREDVGAGYVWARLVSSSSATSISLAVSKTSSASGAAGGFDSIEGVHKVATMVWNATYLQWERSTGATGGGGSVSAAVPTTKRFDKFSDAVMYVGSAEVGTAETSAGWGVQKITFDDAGNPTATLYAVGVWTNRYSLSYA